MSVGKLLIVIHRLNAHIVKVKRFIKRGKQERTTDTTILTKERKKINAIYLSKTQYQAIQLLAMSLLKIKRSLIKKKDYC